MFGPTVLYGHKVCPRLPESLMCRRSSVGTFGLEQRPIVTSILFTCRPTGGAGAILALVRWATWAAILLMFLIVHSSCAIPFRLNAVWDRFIPVFSRKLFIPIAFRLLPK